MTARPRSRLFWMISGAALLVIATFVIALTIKIRLDSGAWRVPEPDDFVRVARTIQRGPSKTIYLERRSIEVHPGDDDAALARSSVLASAQDKPARTKGWSGSDASWAKLVTCVQTMFSPFDVEVTDRRPAGSNFVMVVVGGKPSDIGVTAKVTGLAPFNAEVIPSAVVFAFSGSLRNDVRTTCETIAMEVGHAYGLDHEYLCKDVMTYLRSCGAKTFVDADAPCGEAKKRACGGGAASQNSFRHLTRVLGAHKRQ